MSSTLTTQRIDALLIMPENGSGLRAEITQVRVTVSGSTVIDGRLKPVSGHPAELEQVR